MKRFLVCPLLCFVLLSGLMPAVAQNQPARNTSERESTGLQIQVNGNRVSIQNAQPNTVIEVYSVVGVKLKQYKLPKAADEYQIELPKGCYILKSENIVRKVAIK